MNVRKISTIHSQELFEINLSNIQLFCVMIISEFESNKKALTGG